jgi:hypothetical protein
MPKQAWDEIIASRPQMLPLPIPLPNLKEGDPVEYQPYENIKAIPSECKHLPSMIPRTTPTVESLAADKELAKKVPEFLSKKNKAPKLWVPNHIRARVKCQACDKYRCLYAWPLECEDYAERLLHLDDIIEDPLYEYICGDALFGMDTAEVTHHPLLSDCFYVKRALVCGMPMEAHYYSSRKKFAAVCFQCGTPDGLMDTETLQKKTNGKKALPLCESCYQKPDMIIKTIGRAKQTGKPGARKRGSIYKDTPTLSSKRAKANNQNGDLTKHFDKCENNLNGPLKGGDLTKHFDKKGEIKMNGPSEGEWHPEWLIGTSHNREFAFMEDMQKFGKIEDVNGDGNCGFYVILLGLEKLKKIDRKSVTEFRKHIWEYARTNEMKLRQDAFPESQKKGIGKAISWAEDVLNPLFKDGSSYERGCNGDSWISGQWHFPMIAHLFQVNIVVYSSDKSMRLDKCILDKRTTVSKPNGQSEWFVDRLVHPHTLSVDSHSTIFLVHMHGIHYLRLSVSVDLLPPEEDQTSSEDPEKRHERNPILDGELVGPPPTIV